MKLQENFILIGILVILSGSLKAQKQVTDTLAYLKKFETNKEKYIGKPFSLLLKDLSQLQPKKAKSDINENPGSPLLNTTFRFSESDINSAHAPTMIIKWKPDNSPTTQIEFFEQEHNYRFTISERNFFEKKIVKDIVVAK